MMGRLCWCCLLLALPSCGPSSTPPAPDDEPPDALVESVAAPPPAVRDDTAEARTLREDLVREIRRSPPWSGATWDGRVLGALQATPRHLFVPDAPIALAYEDRPQPIGHGQTISQPTVVAIMTNALELRGTERVLEIGTGSGYQAAVLALLSRRVFTIELVAPLGEVARERLEKLGYSNVEVRIGDGYAGWPEQAPFDRILITAAPPEIPRALLDQLAEGGILVAPVGGEDEPQELVRLTKRSGRIAKENLALVRFVPMVPGNAKPNP
ncbi:protein-L-isoaspartate(D-aspartate) O-methyltransferase [Polyangium jinanense]|nr:protein-L-isoaspartate(D-aspartate) O-methyltransferase [Polyangium jinanense]